MPDTPKRIVVIGGGLAGAKAVEALRAAGYTGSLTLLADEADLPSTAFSVPAASPSAEGAGTDA